MYMREEVDLQSGGLQDLQCSDQRRGPTVRWGVFEIEQLRSGMPERRRGMAMARGAQ
jgi:hypothetical protein